ncbi:MAG: M28 family peptidase [Planctomycetota bacterium]|nr:M28 family peptidase [Planctomycetota bacterium]
MKQILFHATAAMVLVVVPLSAQRDRITEERVREAVSWLASDERGGRDTGSAEIEEAAQWLAARFEAAGLKQLREGSWFHEFAMSGVRVDSDAVKLTLTRRVGDRSEDFELKAGADVRQWRPSDGLQGEESCTVAKVGDPVLQRLLRARSARRPVVIEVPEDHAYWEKSAGIHTVVTRRRQAARPVLLVRAGILPADPGGNKEVEWTASWAVGAPEQIELPQRNVMALLPAAADSPSKDEFVVVSAHYDHVGVGPALDGDSVYNGADDNATGTTGVVVLAEALAAERLRRNVLFVCFAAEEQGLRGSKAFCDRPPMPLAKVVANLNIEMIGRPEEGKRQKCWFTGAGYSDFATICEAALDPAGVEVVDFRMGNQLFWASDNASFVGKGIVAHSVSAGSLHQDYHQPGDEVSKLDIPHMTSIIDGLYAVTKELATRAAPPAWNEQGKKAIERVGRRRR